MAQKYLMRRDTQAWTTQVWLAFSLSVCACTLGVWNMPAEEIDRAFLSVAFCFCLFASFTLAKMIRDNRDERIDTGAWIITVWVGFGLAMLLTAWGLIQMTVGSWERGYMLVSWLFLVNTAFTLAKLVRDKQEADLMEGVANASETQPVLNNSAEN